MVLKQSENGKDVRATVITPFRKTRPSVSLDELLGGNNRKGSETSQIHKTVIFSIPKTGEFSKVPDTLIDLFEGDIMDSVFSTDTGSDLYKKHLQQVMKERHTGEGATQESNSMDAEVARIRAWTEWREKCDLFRNWKPGKTVFNMPAITAEMLARPGNVVSQEAVCATGVISKADIDELSELLDCDKFLSTPQGKVLFLGALSKYAEIKADGNHRSMVFTEEQIEDAKRAAWKKHKEMQSIIVTHDTVFQMPAVKPPKAEEPKIQKIEPEKQISPIKLMCDAVVAFVASIKHQYFSKSQK